MQVKVRDKVAFDLKLRNGAGEITAIKSSNRHAGAPLVGPHPQP
jgi:hypothetical protein